MKDFNALKDIEAQQHLEQENLNNLDIMDDSSSNQDFL